MYVVGSGQLGLQLEREVWASGPQKQYWMTSQGRETDRRGLCSQEQRTLRRRDRESRLASKPVEG